MHAIIEIQKGSGAGFWVQMVSRVSLPGLHGVIFWGPNIYHVTGHQVTDVLQGPRGGGG